MKKKLFIFTNESIFSQEEKFFCDNIDLKSSPEGLNKKFEVNLFGRKSSKKRAHEIKLKKLKIFSNIFSYLSEVKSAAKNEDSKFLIISISPYTFLVSLFISPLITSGISAFAIKVAFSVASCKSGEVATPTP